jgi:hypothetical protein
MKPIRDSKFAVLGANALFGLLLFALSALADDRPPGDQPAKAPQPPAPVARPAPNVPADAVPDRLYAFEEFDADKNGSLARAEVPATLDLARNYANYDLDADGKLSRDEFSRYRRWKEELARMHQRDNAKR